MLSHSQEPLTVTIPTARSITGLGTTTIYQLIKDNRLQTVKVGRRTLVTYSSLKALVMPEAA